MEKKLIIILETTVVKGVPEPSPMLGETPPLHDNGQTRLPTFWKNRKSSSRRGTEFFICAPLTLRAGLRRKEVFLFFPYPALSPQRALHASGTYWANLSSRLTALHACCYCDVATLRA
jgi:hypothetical protein